MPEWVKKRERVKREREALFAMLDAAKTIAEETEGCGDGKNANVDVL